MIPVDSSVDLQPDAYPLAERDPAGRNRLSVEMGHSKGCTPNLLFIVVKNSALSRLKGR
jgi:hypothetical protein